ncbi:serine hydrolase [Novosphingobium sp. BW1]|uniref:serine hydrolase n=1 Tax=Novosphingobium sp. BW1 TaxID=2592621 RepID=UPI0011DEC0C9|nr:serine hydrolase [Novosphingobium sp. BW1]TYC94416.1 serine hydrolase [Novosphingobium sp. BW1]
MIRSVLRTALLIGFATTPIAAGAQSTDPGSWRLRPSAHVAGEPETLWSLDERMKEYHVPGVSVAIVRDGKVSWAGGFGVLQNGGSDKVDADTMFSVGSLSKVGAAFIVLRMVDEGKLDLDRDVNDYLKRWKVPLNIFTLENPVTLRRLLSHTAGINIRGFPDFLPGAKLPTLVDTLEGNAPSLTGPVQVVYAPGSRAVYSGGGISIEQMVVEDVLGTDFESAAKHYLFEPLGMTRSTYAQPLDPAYGNIAKAHDRDGKPEALPRGYQAMPETAASGLWTTPSDSARMVAGMIRSYRGEQGAPLSHELAQMMMAEVAPGPVGLGPFLEGRGLSRRFYHTGSNDSYKAWMEGHLASGDGLVIFTNGAKGSLLYREVRRAVAAAEDWPNDRVVELPAANLPAERLAGLAGTYVFAETHGVLDERATVFPDPRIVRISVRNGRLTLSKPDGGGKQPLIPADRSHFVFASDAARWVEFVTNGKGEVDRLILRNGLSAVEAHRKMTSQP